MGLDLTFYEVKNYDWRDVQKEYYIEEALYLSNDVGMLVSNWLYRNDSGKVVGGYLDYHCTYHQISGDKLVDLYKNIKKIVEADKDKKDIYALFYLPCLYTIDDWVSSIEMFSEAYYDNIEYVFKQLDNFLFGDDAPSPSNRMFFYNISW